MDVSTGVLVDGVLRWMLSDIDGRGMEDGCDDEDTKR
jgi:hypothetical protein